MRKLRVVFTTVGGVVPALMVAFVAPATDACGGEVEESSDQRDASSVDRDSSSVWEPSPSPYDAKPYERPSYIVEIPPPGTAADPGQLCAVPSPVTSNVAARVTLSDYDRDKSTAKGFIAVAPAVEPTIVGLPTIVVSAKSIYLDDMVVTNMTKVAGGFQFDASWPDGVPYGGSVQMTVETTLTISCADGGTTTVQALTKIDLCCDPEVGYEWVSSGDACTVCQVIAEMAPSPIVSDKRGDDLPLGMVVRLRVVEVARAGRHVLLFADNDAGAAAKYEWRVSEGSLEHISDDVMLWTLPEKTNGTPFGQVAVWNDAGAAVENFVSAVTWQEAA
jgi:hypothetical protein